MLPRYQKIPVENISLESFDQGEEMFGDNGRQAEDFLSEEQNKFILSKLTSRQRQVVDLLASGYSRIEISEKLQPTVCVQAVHQIILRIRKRIKDRAGVKTRIRQYGTSPRFI